MGRSLLEIRRWDSCFFSIYKNKKRKNGEVDNIIKRDSDYKRFSEYDRQQRMILPDSDIAKYCSVSRTLRLLGKIRVRRR